tara:strand:+ start:315 stop:581 length:267 start_codon:yes stop_codon:yes gene_type:complete
MIKKTLRILIMILLSPIIYPTLFMAGSIFGIVTMVGFAFGLTYPLAWLGNNDEWKEDCIEAFGMFFGSIWLPIETILGYIRTGKFEID